MKIALIGADLEENLGVGMIGAVALDEGHGVRVIPFDHLGQRERVVDAVMAEAPEVVGLSMQFQHRAHEFLALSRSLRSRGYRGHITCGGQFPSLAWADTMRAQHGIDSAVLYDGEHTFRALLRALASGGDISRIEGLALRGEGDVAYRTEGRRLDDDLDALPMPLRYRSHSRHLGVPFIPVMASRGCWGSCTYCSITSMYRAAREHGGGRTVRLRSPEHVADELAVLWHRAGGDAIFCFHDDNMLLPKPDATLARMNAIRARLDALGVGRAAFIGKCRPETVTPSLARALRDLGVLRLYVGVENAAAHGSGDLGRGTQHAAVGAALDACREAGIFVCYNLLIFEPDATLDDVRENVRFIRQHDGHPVNFCRAEPYHGTPLHRDLEARHNLGGSYLGYDYRVEDPRVELLFRVCAAAFRQRNFDPEGVANRYMGVGYLMKLVEYFYDQGPVVQRASLARRAESLTRSISTDTAEFLAEAIEIAATAHLDDHDRIERETALLGLRIAAADKVWHAQLDQFHADLAGYVREARRPTPRVTMPRVVRDLARRVLVGASLAAWTMSCSSTTVVDPVPPDSGKTDAMDITAVDPAPVDAARNDVAADLPRDTATSDRVDVFVVDPPPPDAGRTDVMVVDPPPPDAGRTDVMVVDPPPPDAGRADVPSFRDIMVVDPPPPDAGRTDVPSIRDIMVVDPLPRDAMRMPDDDGTRVADSVPRRHLELIDRWRETTPRRATRSEDLALSAPPEATLRARREGDAIVVEVQGIRAPVSARWEGDGDVRPEGTAARWVPAADDDQLRVALRTRGGVAVLSLRVCDVDADPRSRSLA